MMPTPNYTISYAQTMAEGDDVRACTADFEKLTVAQAKRTNRD